MLIVFVAGLFLGALVGLMTACICVLAGRAEGMEDEYGKME